PSPTGSAAPSAATPPPPPPPPTEVHAMSMKELNDRVHQFAPVQLKAEVSRLPASERAALDKPIAASKLLDPIFDHQAFAGNPAIRAKLAAATSPEGQSKLAYFDIMRGPWDRQDHFAPFAIDRARPKGAGFYPEDLTADEIHAWTLAHPSDKQPFESLTTIVARDHGKLVAVPYAQAYAEWLKPAAALLVEASKLTTNKSLATFLASRAAAFTSDDYYQSDKDWMDLDSLVEITIGPYETYEDDLLGLKA